MSKEHEEEEGELAMFESKNLATEGFEYSTTLTRCYHNVRTALYFGRIFLFRPRISISRKFFFGFHPSLLYSLAMITTNDISNIEDNYLLLETIGSGTFATVRKCQNISTGEFFAVKSITKARVPHLDFVRREVEILKEMDHPNIIRLYNVFEDTNKIYLVTELCTGGELYEKVVKYDHFEEEVVARWCQQILQAVQYLHSKDIVHRDLKPENFLFTNEEEDSPIKIIDFGLSILNDTPLGVLREPVGSPHYVAPEVLLRSYTSKCDIWSIGAVTYTLLSGLLPFNGKTDKDTLRLVERANLKFHGRKWEKISPAAKDFCRCLLSKSIIRRPTADQALTHPWIFEMANASSSEDFHKGLDENSYQSFGSSLIRYNLNIDSTPAA